MDKILELGDVFGLGAHNLNWTLLIPVSIVVGAVAVFMFGFKKAESPKFRKLVSANSSSGGSAKRKKRHAAEATVAGAVASAPTSNKAVKVVQTPQKAAVKQELTPTKKAATAQHEKKQHTAVGKPLTAVNNNSSGSNTPAKSAKVAAAKGSNSASNKKITAVDKLNDTENGGEWRTVITKKQKKQVDVPIANAEVAESGVKHAKSTKKHKESSPRAVAKKIEAPVATVDVAEAAVAPTVAPVTQATSVAPATVAAALEEEQLSAKQTQHQQHAAEPPVTVEQSSATVAAVEANTAAVSAAAAGSNVAFDELGDTAWTENKPQKKNKKRALKEH